MYIVLGVCEIKQLQCESNGPGSLLYSTASVCYINTKYGVTVTLVEIMQGREGPFSGICYLKPSRMLPRYSFSNKNLEGPQEH